MGAHEKPAGTMSSSAYGIAVLLVVLGALMVADRMTSSREEDSRNGVDR